MTKGALQKIVEEELKNIAPETSPADIGSDEDVREALDIDSMGFLDFITALHDQLGVDIPETDANKLATRAAVLDYLTARLPVGT